MSEPLTGPSGYFEDFAAGQRMRHARGATVGEVENNFISKQVMNTAQAHWNEHHLTGGHLGSGRLVFGLVTASMVFGLASQDTAEQALAEIGCSGLRFKAPVHQGDTLYAFTEVLETAGADRPDAGVVRFKHWGVTHDGRVVFEGERTVLLKRRSGVVTRPERLRRSELSTPGTSPKMMAKAADSGADLVFLDLEDAVAPAQKEAARQQVVAALTELEWGRKTRAYRINGVHTPWCHDDLIDVVTGARRCVDVVIVPKVKSPRDVWFVDDLLTQLERKLGLEVGRIGLELLIEETEALACVEAIAASSSRLEALILGVGDLSASQGIRAGHIGGGGAGGDGAPIAYPGDMWHYARNRMIVAARANGLDPVDGPYADFRDPDAYRREAAWAATLGAVGKWCIHPSQIAVANEVFAPTQAEIDGALKVVNAVRAAEGEGLGAADLGGVMVDAATARIFEGVLRRARLCGLLA